MIRKPTVAVLGSGGIGGLLAGLLARAGYEVVCVGTTRAVKALSEGNLEISSQRFGSFAVSVSAVEELDRPIAACLVAVKAFSLGAALDRVSPRFFRNGILVPFLNGVEHVAQMRERYAGVAVIPATIRVESYTPKPAVIDHRSLFASIDVATANDARANALVSALTASGLDVTVREDEMQMLWDKLAFLAPLALMTTVTAQPIGVVRDADRVRLVAVTEEVVKVARSEGSEVSAERLIKAYDELPEGMHSSMQRDAAAGRPIELDAIGGAVIRGAARAEIDVLVTRSVVEEIEGRS